MKMSNLAKLEFVALDISIDNCGFIMGLGCWNPSWCNESWMMIFLHHHLHEQLKSEYLTVKEPQVIWDCLNERFYHKKMLYFQKLIIFVSQYNSALFKIFSQLKLYGEEITDADFWKRHFLLYMLRICSCSNNIESKDLESILN